MNRRNLQRIGICAAVFLALITVSACKKKPGPTPPAPAPPQPAMAARPTATLTVNPTSIERGQSATIEWTTSNADTVNIEGVGKVNASGSQSVRPTQSTTYRLTATGAGGTAEASARVTVTNPPPEMRQEAPARHNPSEEELFGQQVKTIYFDYDKFDIRDDQRLTLNGNGTFLKEHPSVRIVVEGHCDERGSEEYNLGLGDKRANSIKEALVGMGIAPDRVRTISYGKEKPVCTEATEQCWQSNRRGQFVMDR